MNDQMNDRFEAPTREDVLIGRVTDGEATPNDWLELERIAAQDAGVWQRLADSQRAHARLERIVEDAIAMTELVDVPVVRRNATALFLARWREYSGWAAAALIALVWVAAQRGALPGAGLPPSGGGSIQTAGLNLTPDQAFQQYVNAGQQSGRVLGEIPSRVIDVRQGPESGQREVIIVRQILERKSMDDVQVLEWQQNEFGQPVAVPARIDDGFREGGPY